MGARSFNQPLDTWKMSRVTDTRDMFQDARSFDQDISAWDLSSNAKCTLMFRGATSNTCTISSSCTTISC